MFPIIYLEEKIMIRNAMKICIEQQENCKVIFDTGSIDELKTYLEKSKDTISLCIVSDDYGHQALLKMIQAIRARNSYTYILLKSNEKQINSICYLMKHGLNGIFFTDEPMIDLKQCVQRKTKFNLSADKCKLITKNVLEGIHIKTLNYNHNPLTANEIKFIQACTRDYSYEEIADYLQKSIYTIYGYRDRIFKKLAVKQRTAMVMTALKRNYIDL
ncbi:MAG: response regulator transcription factor [Sediminibacterium sp.]|nr:response regulator transcription factor [Sediminibacterium sp.]